MATEAELLAAITATPDDATRLVYADWLLANGDPRGELIILDHRERTTPGGISNPDQLGQLLRLAAEHGFPHLPDPDAGLLEMVQVGRANNHWQYRGHAIERLHEGLALDGTLNQTLELRGRWSDQQTNALLTIVRTVIDSGASFASMRFPSADQLATLPAFRLGPLPKYHSAEIMEDFAADWLLSARDHARWYRIYERMMRGFSRTSSFKAVKDPSP